MTTIELTLPDEVFAAMRRSPDELAGELRLAAAIFWYSRGLLSRAAVPGRLGPIAFLWRLDYAHTDLPLRDRESLPLSRDGAYVITGGLGGLGLEVANWLVQRGARSLVLVGRQAASDPARPMTTPGRAVCTSTCTFLSPMRSMSMREMAPRFSSPRMNRRILESSLTWLA